MADLVKDVLKARKRIVLTIAKSISEYLFTTHRIMVDEEHIEQLIQCDLPATYEEYEASYQAGKKIAATVSKVPSEFKVAIGKLKAICGTKDLGDTIIVAANKLEKLCKLDSKTAQPKDES
jgi:hypothetical protein